MIAVIRIHGQVGLNKDIKETLNRLKLRKKYSCVLVKPTKDNLGMIKKVMNTISYGEINKETLVNLIKERGKTKGSPTQKSERVTKDAEKIAENILKGKSMKELGLKGYFSLHPPRKGIKSKLPYPKGVLSHNKEINKLINKML